MSSGRKRIYRSTTPLRIAMTVLAVLLALAVLLFTILFFSFRKYIVYTADGLHLEVPWLEETLPEDADTDADSEPGGAQPDDDPETGGNADTTDGGAPSGE